MEDASLVPTLYLRLRKRISVPKGRTITLGMVAQLLTEPEHIREKLERMPVYRPRENDGNLVLVDMMMIASDVKKLFPLCKLEYFGEPHMLVEILTNKRKPNYVMITFVWILLFIGSGLAIMNFHADVSMLEVHQRIVKLITGKYIEHPYVLQIPYSLGIGAGMVIFFNHLFKKKFNEEPNPLEVEMYLYQESMHQYVVTEEYRKKEDPGDGGKL